MTTGDGKVSVDVDGMAALVNILGEVTDKVSSHRRELNALLDEIRFAIGTDLGADVFRTRFEEQSASAFTAIDDLHNAVEAHDDLVRRGLRGLSSSDADSRNDISRSLGVFDQ